MRGRKVTGGAPRRTELRSNGACHFETYDEAAPGSVAPYVSSIAAVSARDLAHQGQPQSSPFALSGTRESVKRSEDPLAVRLRDTGSMAADTQFRPAPGAANAHFDGRRPVAPGVLQEVPDHPAEQARVAAHGNGLALELDGLVTCTFLARECEQINLSAGKHTRCVSRDDLAKASVARAPRRFQVSRLPQRFRQRSYTETQKA
jgi:hypothetical protein